ncbi:MAG TPA: molybdopterin-dependent oxidoreductase, partial [Syntrophomonadaceae bacterium]|nr:molybdopterin-dependent oxidoreductase [Syntrophomonadaceae bacterium]
MKDKMAKALLIIGVLFILGSVLVYLQPWQGQVDAETRNWQLTLVGRDGDEKVLSYKDITGLPAYQGKGGFFSTIGIVYGPYDAKGVTLEELCEQVGGIVQGDAVMITAKDGYSTVLDYEQVMGEFITYNSELKEVPHPELKTILMYKQDGKPLADEDGKPFRIAVVSKDQGLLNEGTYWVKWVNKIEVLNKT